MSGPSTNVPEGAFGGVFFIGLVEEMCGVVSLQRHHSYDCLIAGRSSGPRSLPWTSLGNGELYTAGPSCIDRGFLQATNDEKGEGHYLAL